MDVHAYYLCIYGKAIVDGVEVEDVMFEPRTYNNIVALDSGAHFSQVSITVISTGESLDLADSRKAKIEAMKTTCKTVLGSGFSSDALGAIHTYPSDPEAQFDLFVAASMAMDVNFKCRKDGVDAKRLHTAVQMQTVLQHGVVFKISTIAQQDARLEAIGNAVTIAEVNDVVW
jgi:hypothetical protein